MHFLSITERNALSTASCNIPSLFFLLFIRELVFYTDRTKVTRFDVITKSKKLMRAKEKKNEQPSKALITL